MGWIRNFSFHFRQKGYNLRNTLGNSHNVMKQLVMKMAIA